MKKLEFQDELIESFKKKLLYQSDDEINAFINIMPEIIEYKDIDQNDFLHFSAKHNLISSTQILLMKGMSLEKNNENLTPTKIAYQKNYTDLYNFLYNYEHIANILYDKKQYGNYSNENFFLLIMKATKVVNLIKFFHSIDYVNNHNNIIDSQFFIRPEKIKQNLHLINDFHKEVGSINFEAIMVVNKDIDYIYAMKLIDHMQKGFFLKFPVIFEEANIPHQKKA